VWIIGSSAARRLIESKNLILRKAGMPESALPICSDGIEPAHPGRTNWVVFALRLSSVEAPSSLALAKPLPTEQGTGE